MVPSTPRYHCRPGAVRGQPPLDGAWRREVAARRVVVKIRHRADRLTGCTAVHRRLFDRGFPCPEPLIDLEPMGSRAASAEAMVPGGNLYAPSRRTPRPFGEARAPLVRLAPRPTEAPSLDPAPPWTTPDLDPQRHSRRPTTVLSTSTRLAAQPGSAPQHGALGADWRRQRRPSPLDTVISTPGTCAGKEATVQETAAVLDGCHATRGHCSASQLAVAWAAGLWSRAVDAKQPLAEPSWPFRVAATLAQAAGGFGRPDV